MSKLGKEKVALKSQLGIYNFASSIAHPSENTEFGPRYMVRFQESKSIILSYALRGYDHWIITFSGGKDSTTALIVALETALQYDNLVRRIDIVYSDTLVEIPVIRKFALEFLDHLSNIGRLAPLPLHVHVVYPELANRFWVCMLGKGYPPPHQRFRWCTRRLKIEPVESALRQMITPKRTLIITGVRYGESQGRDKRLRISCSRGGECGQGVWFEQSQRLQIGYLAPIVEWTDCDVWDFVNFFSPMIGYLTEKLETEIYNGRGTRFGCWMCSVVKHDKAMEKITSTPEWSHLRPMLDFRQWAISIARNPSFRLMRSNGLLGKLSIEARQQILGELLSLQNQLGLTLISNEELDLIHALWDSQRFGRESQ
jgi:DNA sulfur modification protein DndC